MVFSYGGIQLSVIDTESPPILNTSGHHLTISILHNRNAGLFRHYMYQANPSIIKYWVNHIRIQEFYSFFTISIIGGFSLHCGFRVGLLSPSSRMQCMYVEGFNPLISVIVQPIAALYSFNISINFSSSLRVNLLDIMTERVA